MAKFSKKLTSLQFFLSQVIVLLIGLIIAGGIHYILNVQYRQSTRPFQSGPVTTTPKSLLLNLDQPEDNSLSFQSSILISGKTAPLKEILISKDSRDQVIESKADGSFSGEIELIEGANRITVVVFDANGDSRSAERTVYFSKERI